MEFEYEHGFEFLQVGVEKNKQHITHIQLARPTKSNAFNPKLWIELPKAVALLERKPNTRVVLISGRGKNFCAGIDTSMFKELFASSSTAPDCPARTRDELRRNILRLQDALTALERCRWPVVAAIHGACIGAGVDLITACDLRYCSQDAVFCVKEIDLAITADLGTLQRLPHIIGHGAAAELALTARQVPGPEAARLGLVSCCFTTQQELMSASLATAQLLAAKPAMALQGTKRILLRARDKPAVSEGLDYVATWNSALLISADMQQILAQSRPSQQRQRPASGIPASKL